MTTNRGMQLKQYRSAAAFGGACVGFLVGALITGPRIHELSVAAVAIWIAGTTALLSLAGYAFIGLFVGGLSEAPTADATESDDDGLTPHASRVCNDGDP
jgi:hypothetical protein